MTLTEYQVLEDNDDESLYDDEYLDQVEGIMIDDHLVELDGRAFVSEEYGFTIRTGVWCEQNDDGEWYGDWGIIIFHENDKSPAEYLYYEQGSISTALHNYSTSTGIKYNTDLFLST